MAIYKFSMLYKNLVKNLGEETALKIFPEYATLPDKMNAADQAALARCVMDRMDSSLDRQTIVKIRHGNTCNLPKEQKREMIELFQKSKKSMSFLQHMAAPSRKTVHISQTLSNRNAGVRFFAN